MRSRDIVTASSNRLALMGMSRNSFTQSLDRRRSSEVNGDDRATRIRCLSEHRLVRQMSLVVMRNSAFGLAAQFAIKVLSFIFSIFVVRLLGADAFGQYAAVLAFGALFTFIGDLGLSPYLVREVARMRDDEDGPERVRHLVSNVLAIRIILSTIAAILMIFAAWLTGRPLVMIGAIALGSIGLLMYSVQGTSDAMLAGYERLELSAAAKVINQFVFVLLGVAALALGTGYYGLIVASLIGIFVMSNFCWRSVRRLGFRLRQVDPSIWISMLRAALPFGLIGFALGMSWQFDSVLLNVFRNDAETGYYNAAYNLIFSAVVISHVLNTSLYPSLSRHVVRETASPSALYERFLRYLIIIALPIAVGGWALADKIVPFLFDRQYLPAIAALRILIWVVPFMYVSEFLGYVVVVAGHERRVARSVLVSTALNVALNIVLVPRFGFKAAAVMTVLTEVVLVSQYVWLLSAVLRQLNWALVLVRPLLAVSAMLVVVLVLRDLPLVMDVGVGAVSYGALLIVFGAIGTDELKLARRLIQGRTISGTAPTA